MHTTRQMSRYSLQPRWQHTQKLIKHLLYKYIYILLFIYKCVFQTRRQFVYGHAFSAIRLAVPLKWESRLISVLTTNIHIELSMLIGAAIILPLLLAIRRHALNLERFTITIIHTTIHILTGDPMPHTLIQTSLQPLIILAIAAIITMLLQLPANIVKGQVVSSTQEDRIQHSNCTINSCTVTSYRGKWFFKSGRSQPRGIIDALADYNIKAKPFGDVTPENLSRSCKDVGLSVSGSLYETMLALLVRYETICDEPEFMKYHLMKFEQQPNETLLFERFHTSHGSNALCVSSVGHRFHVDYLQYAKLRSRVLEHGLLRYLLVNASLREKNKYEVLYWKSADHEYNEWGHRTKVVPKVKAMVSNLSRAYVKHDMFVDHATTKPLRLAQIGLVMRALSLAYVISGCLFFIELCFLVIQRWKRTYADRR